MAPAETGVALDPSSRSTARPRRSAGAGPGAAAGSLVLGIRRNHCRGHLSGIPDRSRRRPLAQSGRTASNEAVTVHHHSPAPAAIGDAPARPADRRGPAGGGPIELTVGALEFEQVVAVAGTAGRWTSAPMRWPRWPQSRAIVDALADDVPPHYGISTGFGALATTSIPPHRRAALQTSLIRSHAAGSGEPVEREVVRALMLLRLATLARGRTGIRPADRRGAGRDAQRRDHPDRAGVRIARLLRRPRPAGNGRARADRRGGGDRPARTCAARPPRRSPRRA